MNTENVEWCAQKPQSITEGWQPPECMREAGDRFSQSSDILFSDV